MHISLTPQLEKYVRGKVATGLYNNASEVIRESLRLLLERDEARERLKAEVCSGFKQIKNGQTTTITSRDEFIKVARANRK